MRWEGRWDKWGLNVRLTAGGAVATHCNKSWCDLLDYNQVREKKRKLKKSMSSLLLVKQSEMILPSVLSEASSLVAERETEEERGGGKARNKWKQKKTKDWYKWPLKVKRHKRKTEKGQMTFKTESKMRHRIMTKYSEWKTGKEGREERSTVCISYRASGQKGADAVVNVETGEDGIHRQNMHTDNVHGNTCTGHINGQWGGSRRGEERRGRSEHWSVWVCLSDPSVEGG